MLNEMMALHSNNTWDLVSLQPSKTIVGCWSMYIANVGPNKQIDRLKVHLDAKGYAQTFELDYGYTFPSVAKTAFVSMFLSIAAKPLAPPPLLAQYKKQFPP